MCASVYIHTYKGQRSQIQNESIILGNRLATMTVVTTPRNELQCDTHGQNRVPGKRRHTHARKAVSAGESFGNNVRHAQGISEHSAVVI